jgi:phosphatidylglycerophosphatase A
LLLRQTDPVSVVLDEIVAVPLCFVSLVGGEYWRSGHLPAPGFFFQPNTWLLTLCVLATFRLVDVFKPWPVRQSQSLPGGWGVVVDDLLAAIYVNLLTCLVWAIAKFCR